MHLDIGCVLKRLDKVVPILSVFSNVQSKEVDGSAVESFASLSRMQLVGRRGEFLHCKERTK